MLQSPKTEFLRLNRPKLARMVRTSLGAEELVYDPQHMYQGISTDKFRPEDPLAAWWPGPCKGACVSCTDFLEVSICKGGGNGVGIASAGHLPRVRNTPSSPPPPLACAVRLGVLCQKACSPLNTETRSKHASVYLIDLLR